MLRSKLVDLLIQRGLRPTPSVLCDLLRAHGIPWSPAKACRALQCPPHRLDLWIDLMEAFECEQLSELVIAERPSPRPLVLGGRAADRPPRPVPGEDQPPPPMGSTG